MAFLTSCIKNEKKDIPEKIGEKVLSGLIEGDNAKIIINKLHQLQVSPQQNYIGEYGDAEKDLLYLSIYQNEIDAIESFNKMINKMRQNTNGPFTYLVPMKKYDEQSFMTLGLGSVHYIYKSGKNIIWLSTKQKFFNELPDNLIYHFPVD